MKLKWGLSVAMTLALLTAPLQLSAETMFKIKPGQYRTQHQIWLDGKEVLSGINAMRQQMLDKMRAGMSAEQRAEFDANMPPDEENSDCVPADEASISVTQYLQQVVTSMQTPPWQCSFSQQQFAGNSLTFNFSCQTPAHATTAGKAKFEYSAESYRVEINNRGHVINGETGAPLGPQLIDGKNITTGQWISAECDE